MKIEVKIFGNEDIEKIVLEREFTGPITFSVFDRDSQKEPLIVSSLSVRELDQLTAALKALKEMS